MGWGLELVRPFRDEKMFCIDEWSRRNYAVLAMNDLSLCWPSDCSVMPSNKLHGGRACFRLGIAFVCQLCHHSMCLKS